MRAKLLGFLRYVLVYTLIGQQVLNVLSHHVHYFADEASLVKAIYDRSNSHIQNDLVSPYEVHFRIAPEIRPAKLYTPPKYRLVTGSEKLGGKVRNNDGTYTPVKTSGIDVKHLHKHALKKAKAHQHKQREQIKALYQEENKIVKLVRHKMAEMGKVDKTSKESCFDKKPKMKIKPQTMGSMMGFLGDSPKPKNNIKILG